MMLAPFISRLCSKASPLWLLVLLGALLGGAPDLIGWYGFRAEHDSWKLYYSAHTGSISKILWYIPMSALHLSIDLVMHGQNKGFDMWNEWMWLEIVMWSANIAVIFLFVRIWKRNTGVT